MVDAYHPEDVLRNPPKPSDITLELLLASQTHLGHSTSRWNPQNSRYIFGIRDGVHIISLDVTAAHLRRAAKVVEEVAARGGLILFAGTREGQKRIVVQAAKLAKSYHIFERWIPGSLTNGQQIMGHCEMKVVNALDRELPQYQPTLEDHAALKPDLVICLNPVENEVMLHECGLHNVPTIGVIDTDAAPTRVTYPIPSNDDSLRAVSVIAGVLGRAGEAGQKRRLDAAKIGRLMYQPVEIDQIGGVGPKTIPEPPKGAAAGPETKGAALGTKATGAKATGSDKQTADANVKAEAANANAEAVQANTEAIPAEVKAADADAKAATTDAEVASADAQDTSKTQETPSSR